MLEWPDSRRARLLERPPRSAGSVPLCRSFRGDNGSRRSAAEPEFGLLVTELSTFGTPSLPLAELVGFVRKRRRDEFLSPFGGMVCSSSEDSVCISYLLPGEATPFFLRPPNNGALGRFDPSAMHTGPGGSSESVSHALSSVVLDFGCICVFDCPMEFSRSLALPRFLGDDHIGWRVFPGDGVRSGRPLGLCRLLCFLERPLECASRLCPVPFVVDLLMPGLTSSSESLSISTL